MTERPAESRRRQNVALVALGLAVVLLIGAILGFVVGGLGDGETAPTTLPPATTSSTTTTTSPSTTTSTEPTTTTTEPLPQQFSFTAVEDTTVDSERPSEILGEAELLEIEQEEDDVRHVLIRFDVSAIPGDQTIAQAILRLITVDESAVPGLVSRVEGPWGELETTWETAPSVGAPIAPLPGGEEGVMTEVDVTSGVTGPGQVDFYLTTSSSDGMDFASKESAIGGPTLIVTMAQPGEATTERSTVLVGAGDIAACDSEGDEATARLLDQVVGSADQAVVFTAGDNAYPSGSEQSFLECYDPSWGRHKDITRPALGSREYRTAGASGHFDYFGVPAGERGTGYYSFDFGGWLVLALNSNCDRIGGCEPGSPQETWLRERLAQSAAVCTVAYWQRPLFTSGGDGPNPEVAPLYQALNEAGAEVVINGNDHFYERFAPQDAGGEADGDGIRQFIVGTGGRSLDDFAEPAANSEVRFNEAFGVLALELMPGGYQWEFITTPDSDFTDRGSGECH